MRNHKHNFTLTILTIAIAYFLHSCGKPPARLDFDGENAYQHVLQQVSFGPRPPGSLAHEQTQNYIHDTLVQMGWEAEVQETIMLGHPIRNIIGKRGEGHPWVVLGAHYDTRLTADEDPVAANRSQPVLGANDGASGVALLLELARVLPADLPGSIWLVFFDAEDNGYLPGWEWILGSQAFVASLNEHPDEVVIVDMIGDQDLKIFIEQSSTSEIVAEIWEKAAELEYGEYFVQQPGYTLIDDHAPFAQAGIPVALIIDFDYAYWHTTQDTADKVSAESLEIVGTTIQQWIIDNQSKEGTP